MNSKKMITTSIFLIALGLIISAIGGFIYNTYSTADTNNSFEEAKKERTQLDEKLNEEFKKASSEMQEHKDSLNAKVEQEANTIIEELKSKSLEAKEALENLKSQSNLASAAISEDVGKFREYTEKELEQLAFPLPTNLFATSISININPTGLGEFMGEIREKFSTQNLDSEHLGKEKFASRNSELTRGELSDKFFDVFDNKTLHMTLQFGDENGPISRKNGISEEGVIWIFSTEIRLNDPDVHLLYFIDNESNQKEYIRLIIGNNLYNFKQYSRFRSQGGISSAKELCGKKVYISLQINNNQQLLPPTSTFQHILFRDNYSREYMIEINGTKTLRHDLSKIYENLPPEFDKPKMRKYWDQVFIIGTLKCLSF